MLSATAEVLSIQRDDIARVIGRDVKEGMRHLGESLGSSTTVLREHDRQARRKAQNLVRLPQPHKRGPGQSVHIVMREMIQAVEWKKRYGDQQ